MLKQDISVVVQGPVIGGLHVVPARQLTQRCLRSIRRHLPHAEIVLSTWRGSDVDGLDYDTLVESDDPGACLQNDSLYVWNNSNRQIVTTNAGLARASGAYVAKIRSDMLMTGSDWLRYFGRFRARNERWRIVEDRILGCTVFARNPNCRSSPYPYHPSDWFFFGRKTDLTLLWAIPLQPEPDTSRYFASRPRPFPDCVPSNLMRYTPEQYLWISFLRKHQPLTFEHCHDLAHDALGTSELSIANNLVLLEPKQLSLRFLKYRIPLHEFPTLYTHGDWLRLYRKYCDPTFKPRVDFTRIRHRLLQYVYLAPRHALLSTARVLGHRRLSQAR